MDQRVNVEATTCSVDEVLDHPAFEALWSANAAECAIPQLSPAKPDADFYRRLEAGGYAICFRCGTGDELHGYALMLMAPSGHNRQRYGTVESLFVSEEARGSGGGTRLMKTIESAARESGCEAVFVTAHVGSRLARLMFLEPERCTLANLVFCWRLR